MKMKYSVKYQEDGYSYAQEYSLNVSYKSLTQVCKNIKGLPVAKALDFLNKAEKMETAVLYSTFNKKMGHRRELGGKKGRYPVKAIGMVKKVLLNAVNNARVLQIDEDSLVVAHAAANKQHSYSRLAPKGKRMKADFVTAKLEIALKGEVKKIAEVSLPEKKEKKKKKGDEVKPEVEVKEEVETPVEEVAEVKPEAEAEEKKEVKKKKTSKKKGE